MTATLTLRPYQSEGLARIAACQARGVNSVLGVAATGLGKTVMFVELMRASGGRGLVLVHRDELVNQAVVKLAEAEPERPVTAAAAAALGVAERTDLLADRVVAYSVDAIGVVKAAADDVDVAHVVASVQTLARPKRMARLLAAGTFSTVVVDEAHHSRADSYVAIIEALRAGAPGGPLLLGVTATPERGDGLGLADIFDEVAFNYDILWGIRSGYLSDLRARRIVLDGFDEKALRVRAGDFTAGSSGRALEDADAPRHIVASWMSEAMGRKTLVFTPTVALAEACSDAFRAAGVRAAWVCGETPMGERHELLSQFREGEVQVMVNCAVLTEGYDEPSIDCIVVARPTKSQALYVQMVGRGTRRWPGKDDCLVLDVVGATDRHSLITVPSLFGLEDDAAVVQGVKLLSAGVADHEEELIEQGRLAARDAQLFKAVSSSPIAWVTHPDPRTGLPGYMRTLGAVKKGGEVIYLPSVRLVRRDATEDSWCAGLQWDSGAKRVLRDKVPLATAMAVGEDFVRKSPNQRIVSREAAWRDDPGPTFKQRELADKWKIKFPAEVTTKGAASDHLDAEITKKKERSAARKAARR